MGFVLFLAGTFWFTRYNQFPFYYHPDESGKVKQILKGTRNFHHPLLLLTSTRWATKLEGQRQPTPQQIVVAGRLTSALFSAGAVLALALLARRMGGSRGRFGLGSESEPDEWAGVLAGWSAGVLGLMSTNTFELAHYMKEDPSYAVGIALTFLALHVYWKRRDLSSVAFVGLAAAVAASGKYLGWLVFPCALWLLLAGGSTKNTWKSRLPLFLASFVILWAILNYSFFKNPMETFRSLSVETDGAIEGHRGYTKSVPNAYYFFLLLKNPPAILALFGVYVAGLFWRSRPSQPASRRTTAPEWLVFGFSLGLTILMSFSPKTSLRYFLPVNIVLYFGAGLGAVWLANGLSAFLPRRQALARVGLWAVLLGLAIWGAEPLLADKYRALQTDDRDQLKEWIRTQLPQTAILVQDDRIDLATHDRWEYMGAPILPQRILHKEFVADLGPLPELRRQGVTHVLVAFQTYHRFFVLTPLPRAKERFDRQKSFYASLGLFDPSQALPGVKLVWQTEPGGNIYLHPGIKVFDITGVAPATEAPAAKTSKPAADGENNNAEPNAEPAPDADGDQ